MQFKLKKSTIYISLAAIIAIVGVSGYLVNGVIAAIQAPTTNSVSSKEINDLNSSIEQKKKQLDEIKDKQEQYKKVIAEKQAEQATLKNQLAIVDNRLAESQLNLDQVKVDIETTNLEIQKNDLEINETDKSIKANKSHLSSAIRLLSQEGDRSQLEVLLLNNYLTDYISQVKYLEDINGKITNGLSDLKTSKDELAESKIKLEAGKEKLRQLRSQLEEQSVQLASEKDSKAYILDETKSSEAEYQRLLAQAKREQQSASSDIVSLEKKIRSKLNAQGSTSVPLKYNGFIWPVPKNTITATFHDPSYPFRYVFEHPAIDIRAGQGTPLRAAASGYVGRAKDGGMGYSYIMLVHGDGLATVYGHVSRIYVKEDEYVTQGQVIGLSGAMPGTPGAGSLTTGPHLHFEVRLNGIPVNPLEYL
ncbi:MAG: peptidoglycan DD-metalloendopeptidase family protein [Candidatus Falkowbacteria bacterium]|nr:peptidoglycan DD-metalloendopeptidase family protein [Candidatus Falkowbacteria bacterium]